MGRICRLLCWWISLKWRNTCKPYIYLNFINYLLPVHIRLTLFDVLIKPQNLVHVVSLTRCFEAGKVEIFLILYHVSYINLWTPTKWMVDHYLILLLVDILHNWTFFLHFVMFTFTLRDRNFSRLVQVFRKHSCNILLPMMT